MIVDTIFTSMTDYSFAGSLFVKAFAWLKENDLENLEPGVSLEIDGRRVTAQLQAYTTGRSEEFEFETHRSFIDIQYIVKGREIIEWAPLAKLPRVTRPYNPDKDITYYANPTSCIPVELFPGDFAVFFPSDGHKPKCSGGAPQEVKKIILKLSV